MDFFNKVGEKLTEAGKDVSKKAKEVSDIAKTAAQIKSDENAIVDAYTEIGKIVYHGLKEDKTADYSDQVQILDELFADKEKNEALLQELKGVTKCIQCGADVEAGDFFCKVCGAKQVKEGTCPNCGAVLPEGTNFCSACGTKIGL